MKHWILLMVTGCICGGVAAQGQVYQTTTDSGVMITLMGTSQEEGDEEVYGYPRSRTSSASQPQQRAASQAYTGTHMSYQQYNTGQTVDRQPPPGQGQSPRPTPTPRYITIRPQSRPNPTPRDNPFRRGNDPRQYRSHGVRASNSDSYVVRRSSAKTRLTSKYRSLGSFGDYAVDDFDAYLNRKNRR